MTLRFSLVRASIPALAAVLLALAALPSEAAGRPSATHGRHAAKAQRAQAVKPNAADAEATETTSTPGKPTGVWTSGEQERACFRTRRKLWQDGEGWVVKRVSVCP